jgi:Holliday junction DNA helicase RuvA
MIAFIDGQVVELRDSSVVLQAGHMGIEVFAPKPTLVGLDRGAVVRLHTHLVVREDILALYGFHSAELLELFQYLITVSGVGPKLGLAILSALPGPLVASAVLNGDSALLMAAPGVGKRIAERLVLELKGRLPETLQAEAGSRKATSVLTEAGDDAIEALLALGYREAQVRSLIAELALASPSDGAEALIRKGLSRLR